MLFLAAATLTSGLRSSPNSGDCDCAASVPLGTATQNSQQIGSVSSFYTTAPVFVLERRDDGLCYFGVICPNIPPWTCRWKYKATTTVTLTTTQNCEWKARLVNSTGGTVDQSGVVEDADSVDLSIETSTQADCDSTRHQTLYVEIMAREYDYNNSEWGPWTDWKLSATLSGDFTCLNCSPIE